MPMKTIAIDIRLLGKKRTGDEMVFRHLTREALALDRESRYLLLTDETDRGRLTALYHELDIVGRENIEIISLSGRNRFVWNLFTMPRFLIGQRIDVFHTQYILPLFVPRRTRVILHIHDVSFRAMPWMISWKDRFFLSALIPHALRRANTIIVPSRFTQDEVVGYYGVESSKVAVVPNALGEGFDREASDREVSEVRERYGLPERYIVAVGTLQPRKNLPLLIRAVAELRKRDPEISLVLVGNRAGHHFDSEIDHAIAETRLGDVVVFPGFVAAGDLAAVVRGAIVYAFPSRYEGFGIPLLEAMSQGVPVASSDIPCLREVAGEAALYFDPLRVDACTEILYTLTIDSDLRKRLIEAGKSCITRYSWERSAQLLVKIYAEE